MSSHEIIILSVFTETYQREDHTELLGAAAGIFRQQRHMQTKIVKKRPTTITAHGQLPPLEPGNFDKIFNPISN